MLILCLVIIVQSKIILFYIIPVYIAIAILHIQSAVLQFYNNNIIRVTIVNYYSDLILKYIMLRINIIVI